MEINYNCKDNSLALKQQLNRVVKVFSILFSIVGVWFFVFRFVLHYTR